MCVLRWAWEDCKRVYSLQLGMATSGKTHLMLGLSLAAWNRDQPARKSACVHRFLAQEFQFVSSRFQSNKAPNRSFTFARHCDALTEPEFRNQIRTGDSCSRHWEQCTEPTWAGAASGASHGSLVLIGIWPSSKRAELSTLVMFTYTTGINLSQ